jgi:hypothetical protein
MSDVYNGLPRRVKIGQYTFRVLISKHSESPDLEHCDGLTDFEKFRIYLDESLPRQRAINVVQHEFTHAINWVYGVDDGAEEEHITTQHTNGLIEMWVSNPKVMNWFVKNLRAMKSENAKDEE